jgi:hypothetical protein
MHSDDDGDEESMDDFKKPVDFGKSLDDLFKKNTILFWAIN